MHCAIRLCALGISSIMACNLYFLVTLGAGAGNWILNAAAFIN